MLNVAVVIPALNEEKNIGDLLADIVSQKLDENFIIEKIIVISDGSNDKTDKIVLEYCKKDARIKLVRNKKRIGKIYSLDKTFKLLDNDALILLDADIRLDKKTFNYLVNSYSEEEKNNYFLIAGNPIPFKPNSLLNFTEQASYFSWLIQQRIKKSNPRSIYSAHGRILVLSNKLYKSINIQKFSTVGTDQIIYLKCILMNGKFYYTEKAKIYYKLPLNLDDYLKQNIRFRLAKLQRAKSFNKNFIKKQFKIPNKFFIIFTLLVKHFYKGLIWLIFYIFGDIDFLLNKNRLIKEKSNLWEISKSTK